MRVVVAPEALSGDLNAGRAAAAIRTGWVRVAPGTVFVDRTAFVDDAADVDLVVAGLAVLDWRALRDSPLAVLAAAAAARGAPCVVLAGRVLAGRRELAAIGVDAVHEIEVGHDTGAGRGIGEPTAAAVEAGDVEAAATHLAVRWAR